MGYGAPTYQKGETNMTDTELLQALYNDMQAMKGDMQSMKEDMQSMKEDMQSMKEDIQSMKEDMQSMKDELRHVKERLTTLELKLENETNHNIQLLAENHMSLVDKLNNAIRVQDKSILFEVQVSGLKSRIDIIEREISELKAKIA